MIATPDRLVAAGAALPSGAYLRLFRRRAAILAALAAALVASCAVDVAVGPSGLDLGDVARTLLSTAGGDPVARMIVLDIRLPVALTAVVVGASLAVAGAQMQTVLDNPLASPFTLGISAAASFKAALAIVLGVGLLPVAGPWLVTANAFVAAMLAALLVHGLSRLRGVTVVLLGIALVFTFNALLALLQFVASEQALQEVVFWTLGSLGKASWPKLGVAAAVLAACVPLLTATITTWTRNAADEQAMEDGHGPLWQRLIELVAEPSLAGLRVLGYGCNQGGLLRLLHARKGFREALGCDVAAESVAVAEARKGDLPVRHVAGADLAGYPGRFNVAFSHEVVYLLPDIDAHARAVHAALAPGGVYYTVTGCHTGNPRRAAMRDEIRARANLPPVDRSPEDYARAFAAAGFAVTARRFGLDAFMPLQRRGEFADDILERLDYYDRVKLCFRLVKGGGSRPAPG